MDKFISGNDPFREGASRIYIAHLVEPIAIFRIEDNVPDDGEIYKKFRFQGDDWILCLHHWGSSQSMDVAKKLMDKAWKWYKGWLTNIYC